MGSKEILSQPFIEHTLGLSEIRLNVELACRKHHLELKEWRDEKALKASYDRVAVGNRLEAILPDAYLVLRLPQARLVKFFLEYDRALENIKFIKKKMSAYVAYFRTGLCLKRYGTNQILCVDSQRRERQARAAIHTSHPSQASHGGCGGWISLLLYRPRQHPHA